MLARHSQNAWRSAQGMWNSLVAHSLRAGKRIAVVALHVALFELG